MTYTVSGKKENKMFSVISPTKLGQFRWNLARSFLNKFAATWCKRFPPHLNNVSTLPCGTWNAHRARATIVLLDRETPEFIPPQLWFTNSPDLNPVDNNTWTIRKMYKTCITDLELSMTPLTDGCHNDDMIQLVPFRSQSLFQFV